MTHLWTFLETFSVFTKRSGYWQASFTYPHRGGNTDNAMSDTDKSKGFPEMKSE